MSDIVDPIEEVNSRLQKSFSEIDLIRNLFFKAPNYNWNNTI